MRRVASVAVLISVTTGVALAHGREARPLPTVSFAELPAGWHELEEARGATAMSWRYQSPNSHGWASSMPRNAIAVQVWFLQRTTPRFAPAPLELVMPSRPATTLEGAPDTPVYRIRGRVRGRDVEIHVAIRHPHPTRGRLVLAQRAISAIRFT